MNHENTANLITSVTKFFKVYLLLIKTVKKIE